MKHALKQLFTLASNSKVKFFSLKVTQVIGEQFPGSGKFENEGNPSLAEKLPQLFLTAGIFYN